MLQCPNTLQFQKKRKLQLLQKLPTQNEVGYSFNVIQFNNF